MHISDIKKFLRCPRLYQLSQNSKREYFSYFNIPQNLEQTIAEKLHIEKYACGQVGQSNEDTFVLLKENSYLFKARFTYHDLRVKVPLIEIKEHRCVLYFYYLLTSISSEEIHNIAITAKTIEMNGLIVEDIRLMHLNGDYIRQQQLDCQKLWIMDNRFNKNGTTAIELYRQNEPDLDELVKPLLEISDLAEPIRTSKCSGRRKCDYYDDCFPQEKDLPDNSILHLVSSQFKYDMFRDGIRYLKDADPNRTEGNRVQKAQINADINGGLYIDKKAVSQWLKEKITYPIAFVDFEWDLYPIPPYQGMFPLEVLPFQYSLDVDDGNELKHYQFIGENDCREAFIQSLLATMPKQGTVVAYNATGAEQLRLKELAKAFPEYADELLNINKRMVDLAVPFTNGSVYHTAMAGSFTLKTIESIVDQQHSYKDLDCGNGIEAVDIHRKLSESNDEAEKEMYRQQLYQYCGLDSYSMVKVYQFLVEKSTE